MRKVRIETFADGSYQPFEAGFAALALPVADWDGDIFDSVAWLPTDPTRWWIQYRLATHLGHFELRRAWWDEREILLVGTPMEWLAHGGNAVCILDWSADLRALLSWAIRVVCSTSGLARKLEAGLSDQAKPIFEIGAVAS